MSPAVDLEMRLLMLALSKGKGRDWSNMRCSCFKHRRAGLLLIKSSCWKGLLHSPRCLVACSMAVILHTWQLYVIWALHLLQGSLILSNILFKHVLK